MNEIPFEEEHASFEKSLPLTVRERAFIHSREFTTELGIEAGDFELETSGNRQIVQIFDAEGAPKYTHKIPQEANKERSLREASFFQLLKEKGFKDEETGVPDVLHIDENDGSLLVTHETGNLSKSGNMGEFLTKVLVSFRKLRNIDNPDDFPFENLKKNSIKEYLTFADERLGVFKDFIPRLNDLPQGYQTEDAEILSGLMEKLGIYEKLLKREQEIASATNGNLDLPLNDLFCIDPSDQSPSNYSFKVDKGGKTKVALLDGEFAQYQSQLVSVAIFATHPGLRFYFENPQERQDYIKRFLVDYAKDAKLDDAQLAKMNLILKVSHYVWTSVSAKNLALGRQNWRELFGGYFRSRLNAVTALDLPVLDEMLTEEAVQIDRSDIEEGRGLAERQHKPSGKLKRPFSENSKDIPPATEFERWVAETLSTRKKLKSDVNGPLEKAGIQGLAEQELADEPYIVLQTLSADRYSSGLAYTVFDYDSFYAAEIAGYTESRTGKKYGFITETEEQVRKGSEKLLILTDKPVGTPKKRDPLDEVYAPPELVAQISELSRDKNRTALLCNNLSGLDNSNAKRKMVKVNVDERSFDYYSLVNIELDDGTSLIYKVSRIGSDGSRGARFLPKHEGRYRLIVNNRLVSYPNEESGNKNEWECAGGYSSANGGVTSELVQELGYPIGSVTKSTVIPIKEDTTVGFSVQDLHIIDVAPPREGARGVDFNDFVFADPFETIRETVDLTPAQAFQALKYDKIHDSYTVMDVFIDLARNGQIEVATDSPTFISLQENFNVAYGDYMYYLPSAPEGTGKRISYIDPDNGTQRRRFRLSEATSDDAKGSSELVSFEVRDVVNKIASAEFDAPTSALLIKGLVNKGIIRMKV